MREKYTKKTDANITNTLPSAMNTAATEAVIANCAMLCRMSPKAERAALQKECPRMAIMMYAFFVMNCKDFWKHQRQQCTTFIRHATHRLFF